MISGSSAALVGEIGPSTEALSALSKSGGTDNGRIVRRTQRGGVRDKTGRRIPSLMPFGGAA